MTLELLAIFGLLFLVLAIISRNVPNDEELSVEAQEAIRHLLSAGACIELKRWHLYRTKSGKFGIMQFDEKSNLVLDSDATYEDMEKAISVFVEKTK